MHVETTPVVCFLQHLNRTQEDRLQQKLSPHVIISKRGESFRLYCRCMCLHVCMKCEVCATLMKLNILFKVTFYCRSQLSTFENSALGSVYTRGQRKHLSRCHLPFLAYFIYILGKIPSFVKTHVIFYSCPNTLSISGKDFSMSQSLSILHIQPLFWEQLTNYSLAPLTYVISTSNIAI